MTDGTDGSLSAGLQRFVIHGIERVRCAARLGLRGGLLGLLRLGLLGLERGEQVGLQRVELHPHPLQLAGFGERACGLLQLRGAARGLVRGLARLRVALQLSLLLLLLLQKQLQLL